MTRLERSIEIKAPPEKVWELLAWDRLPEWYPSIKTAEYTSEKREGVGATAHVTGEDEEMKQKFEYDIEVTECVENERATWRTTSGDFTAFGSTTLKPTEAGTELTMMIDYHLPYSILGKIIDRLKVRKLMEKYFETGMENLKSIAEK